MTCELTSNTTNEAIGAQPCSVLPQAGVTLADVEIFRSLPPDTVQMLSRRCRWRCYGAHRTVIRCQDKDRDVYFVARGRACAIYHAASGREVRFSDLPAGEIFGDFAAIDGAPRSADVVTLTEALIASVTAEAFWDLLRQHDSVMTATLRRLTGIARAQQQRIVEFSTLPVRARIHAELLRLGRVNALGPGRCSATITPVPTHATIASRISTNREAVTRELNDLARVGLVEKRGGALVIRDVAALAETVRDVFDGPSFGITL